MPGRDYFPSDRVCGALQLRSGLPFADGRRLLNDEDRNVESALTWIRDGKPLPGNKWFRYHCPSCGAGSHKSNGRWECSSCGWLKYPTNDRDQWGKAGGCPDCGFMYRWDGCFCSHCGHGTNAYQCGFVLAPYPPVIRAVGSGSSINSQSAIEINWTLR
jgi:ribosomal protein S27AE